MPCITGLKPNCQIIIGGDLDSHLDSSLDNLGGKVKWKPYRYLENLEKKLEKSNLLKCRENT